MSKKLLFRADGNREIGLGHLYRLLGLVDIYKDHFECLYLTKEDSEVTVIPKTFLVTTIPAHISIQDEPNWLKEKYSPKEYLIIADGYQFNSQYQKNLKDLGFSLMYIDDLVSEHMYADVVVNHSPGLSPDQYEKEAHTLLALGTQYAMLRSEFLEQIGKPIQKSRNNHVFVCFGGSDPSQFSLKVCQALLRFKEIEQINLVLGAANLDNELLKLKEKHEHRISLYKNLSAKELSFLMQHSEWAIVPSSTILYELCCINIPILSGYYVENQRRIHNGFLDQKALYSMGDISSFKTEDFISEIRKIIAIENHTEQLVQQEKLFDTKIKKRYIDLIQSLC